MPIGKTRLAHDIVDFKFNICLNHCFESPTTLWKWFTKMRFK